MDKGQERKLISVTGYAGFVRQLKPGEILVIRYKTGRGTYASKTLDCRQTFNRVLYHQLQPHEIGGFYAVAAEGSAALSSTEATPVSDSHDVDSGWISDRRPIEQLVCRAMNMQISAVFFA